MIHYYEVMHKLLFFFDQPFHFTVTSIMQLICMTEWLWSVELVCVNIVFSKTLFI